MRLILATEGERVTDSNLEDKENFTQIFYSSDKTEFLDRGELMVRITGWNKNFSFYFFAGPDNTTCCSQLVLPSICTLLL